MTLVTLRRRTPRPGAEPADLSVFARAMGWGLVALASATVAWLAWQRLGGAPNPGLGLVAFLQRGTMLPCHYSA